MSRRTVVPILILSQFRQPVDLVISAGCALELLGVATALVQIWSLPLLLGDFLVHFV
jgi:hypothetical protein